MALWLAGRDPRIPLLVKTLAVLVAGYALSPIDLIPDFIPVLGYLDEVLLLPLAIAGIVRLIDPALWAEHRLAAGALLERPASRVAAVLIVSVWICSTALLAWWLWPRSSAAP
ncbi:YkvA family protein [Terrihabitans rhizophilus]|uniref:YkvA family protein n=1 Tax=Terrihabitans rhizophilus TaxID=3092662 RepID=A0ABU4RPC4_9HYPH|nr:YkvA family protein [Terrihabitans sp. PJ23]MDX6806038.1 YkvA family protein [Terrihabitans sp. PJ23]